MNPEFPDDPKLRDMARQTVDDWNQAMKETVAGLLLTSGRCRRRRELQTCRHSGHARGGVGVRA